MTFSAIEFVMLALATLRLMRLLRYDYISNRLRAFLIEEIEHPLDEEGAVEIITRGRGEGFRYHFGELYACHWCVSIWSALFLLAGLSIFPVVFSFIISVLSIAALASSIQFLIETFG
ncbi:Protein of unknown function [Amphibacillus marinus]|uniref:Sporulation protein YjcA n=1 Tax=Amphibacillus marinus TaxID=872970 RepID=A0A1H8JZE9_9BACI|nr:DUF1360 domain-containing protein [Amphibacillus marinus]SEN86129.1 Protein of unknown function [Amphibacillus marinus]